MTVDERGPVAEWRRRAGGGDGVPRAGAALRHAEGAAESGPALPLHLRVRWGQGYRRSAEETGREFSGKFKSNVNSK